MIALLPQSVLSLFKFETFGIPNLRLGLLNFFSSLRESQILIMTTSFSTIHIESVLSSQIHVSCPSVPCYKYLAVFLGMRKGERGSAEFLSFLGLANTLRPQRDIFSYMYLTCAVVT